MSSGAEYVLWILRMKNLPYQLILLSLLTLELLVPPGSANQVFDIRKVLLQQKNSPPNVHYLMFCAKFIFSHDVIVFQYQASYHSIVLLVLLIL